MDFFDNLFKGKSEVEKAQKKLDDIKGKCKVDTEVAEKALSDAKFKQVPADADADKAAADAKLVADKAAADAKVAVEKATADVKPPAVGGKGKSKRVRFSKKIKGGKNKKRVKTNKKRR